MTTELQIQKLDKAFDYDLFWQELSSTADPLQAAFGTPSSDIDAAFAALDHSGSGQISVDDLVHAAREYYTSPDPDAPGNQLFGPL